MTWIRRMGIAATVAASLLAAGCGSSSPGGQRDAAARSRGTSGTA